MPKVERYYDPPPTQTLPPQGFRFLRLLFSAFVPFLLLGLICSGIFAGFVGEKQIQLTERIPLADGEVCIRCGQGRLFDWSRVEN